MNDRALLLARVGAALLVLGVTSSLWASPDRWASLPSAAIALVGAAAVLGVTGRRLPWFARKATPRRLALFFLCAAFLALATTLLASRWPTYKLSWLNAIYAAIPSMRSLPFAWAAEGLQPNQTGGFLAVSTAFAAGLALSRPSMRRRALLWPAGILAVAGFVVVFMTGSRAALAALVVALLLMLVVRTRRWVWGWGAGIVVVVGGLLASGQLGRVLDFFLRDESLNTKLVARLDIWSSALRGIEDHLLTGIGLNVFNQVMPVRYPYQTVGLAYPVSQAHNLALDITLAIGLPGIIGLAALFAGCALLALRSVRKGDPATRAVSLGILASMVAYLIFGITDSISLSIPTSFVIWLWAIALAALEQPTRATTHHSAVAPDRYNRRDLPCA